MVKKKVSKKKTPKKKTASRRSKSDEKTKAKYTTRHGSHLTKTTVGVSDTEEDIKEKAK
jgi:hypothetical protein